MNKTYSVPAASLSSVAENFEKLSSESGSPALASMDKSALDKIACDMSATLDLLSVSDIVLDDMEGDIHPIPNLPQLRAVIGRVSSELQAQYAALCSLL